MLAEQNVEMKKTKQEIEEALHALRQKEEQLLTNVEELEKSKQATLNILEDLHHEKSKLASAKAKDEAILESIGDGMIVTNELNQVTIMNASAEKMLGITLKKAYNKKWHEIVIIKDKEKKLVSASKLPTEMTMHGRSRTVKGIYFFERLKDKISFPVAVTGSAVVDDGTIIGSVVVFRDITKERAVDQAKTEFVSLASHQLRTPLSTINWYSEMLLSEDAGNLSHEQHMYVKEIFDGKFGNVNKFLIE